MLCPRPSLMSLKSSRSRKRTAAVPGRASAASSRASSTPRLASPVRASRAAAAASAAIASWRAVTSTCWTSAPPPSSGVTCTSNQRAARPASGTPARCRRWRRPARRAGRRRARRARAPARPRPAPGPGSRRRGRRPRGRRAPGRARSCHARLSSATRPSGSSTIAGARTLSSSAWRGSGAGSADSGVGGGPRRRGPAAMAIRTVIGKRSADLRGRGSRAHVTRPRAPGAAPRSGEARVRLLQVPAERAAARPLPAGHAEQGGEHARRQRRDQPLQAQRERERGRVAAENAPYAASASAAVHSSASTRRSSRPQAMPK